MFALAYRRRNYKGQALLFCVPVTVYGSFDLAKEAAEQLATTNTGNKYYIMQGVAEVIADPAIQVQVTTKALKRRD